MNRHPLEDRDLLRLKILLLKAAAEQEPTAENPRPGSVAYRTLAGGMEAFVMPQMFNAQIMLGKQGSDIWLHSW